MRGDVHGFLSGGGIKHEQNFLRLDEVAQENQFLDERFVNLQPAGSIKIKTLRLFSRAKSNAPRAIFKTSVSPRFTNNRNFNLFAEGLQLIHGRWADRHPRPLAMFRGLVCGSKRASLALEVVLPEPVQADHQDGTGRAIQIERGVLRAQQVHHSSLMILMIC